MYKKQSISDQAIIECLNTNYGIKTAHLHHLALGADIHASVYKAQTHDQVSYFIKIKHGSDYDISTIIQTLLHESGIKHVIPSIKTHHGSTKQPINNSILVVYPFIEGTDGFQHSLTNDQWITLGKTLKRIHTLHIPLLIKDMIQQETYSPKWQQAVRSLYSAIDTEHVVHDTIGVQLATFMKQQRATIKCLVDRAEQLGQKIQKLSPEFVLCHADIHGGNVLISNDGSLYIVDWDQPIMAPKERDLMFIGAGIANAWNDPREEALFYTGYGSIQIHQDTLAYYRYNRIIEDIAEYGHNLLLTPDGGHDREMMYKQCMDMFEPRGVVEIALKTDTEL